MFPLDRSTYCRQSLLRPKHCIIMMFLETFIHYLVTRLYEENTVLFSFLYLFIYVIIDNWLLLYAL